MEFNYEAMKYLAKQDLFIGTQFVSLKNKNKHVSDEEVLEVLFNSYVLDDFDMEDAYREIYSLLD